jgi:hypothetical protein
MAAQPVHISDCFIKVAPSNGWGGLLFRRCQDLGAKAGREAGRPMLLIFHSLSLTGMKERLM